MTTKIEKNQINISNETAVSGGTTTSLVTTGEKYTWNNKQDALPSQSGNNGKFLTTDGSSLNWGEVNLSSKQDKLNNTNVLTTGSGNVIDGVSANDGVVTATKNTTLATVATTGSYNDLSNKPTIGSATVTLKVDGTAIGTINVNATENSEIVIPSGGSATLNIFDIDGSTYPIGSTLNVSPLTLGNAVNIFRNGLQIYQGQDKDYTISGSVITFRTALEQGERIAVINANLTAVDLTPYVRSSELSTVATTGDYNDLINKPTSISSYNDLQDKPMIISNNISIASSDWVANSDEGYTEYTYKYNIPCTGVTDSMYSLVVFGPTEVNNDNYSKVSITGNGTVTIYSKINDAITIPKIIVIK